MCWKSKYKPMLEIAEEDIPVQKVLDVKGDELWSPLYPFKWKLNGEYAAWLPTPIFNDTSMYWEVIVGFNSSSSIHMIDFNFARMCQNKFGMTVLATSNFRSNNWKIFDCIIPKGAKYYKNEYEDYISDGLIILKEEGYGWDSDNKELEELEQSPTDIAKSGFHEGDWITFYGGCPFKILKVESELNGVLNYLLLNQNGQDSYLNKKYVDENARLWTIQDAKPGDVLVCPKYANDTIPNIFIFKYIDRKDNDVYCYCSFLKVFATGGYVTSADPIDTDFCPATKEQCDILFTKMKEAGYMWDSEKKELKINLKIN